MNDPGGAHPGLVVVGELLRELGVPHMVCGSLASSRHGEARSTYDFDLVAELRPEHAQVLAARLKREFYAEEELIADAIRRRSSFNLVHLGTGLKIDVFQVRDREFSREELRRAELQSLGTEHSIPMATAEDTLLTKLEWYRKAGEVSDRQWRDVCGIVLQQGNHLDTSYCRRWAVELGIDDLLDRALGRDRT